LRIAVGRGRTGARLTSSSSEPVLTQLIGIGFKVAATLLFVIMAAVVKYVSESAPIGQIVFFRSFFCLPVLVVWAIALGEFPTAFRTRNLRGHFYRCLFGGSSMTLFFIALALLPLPNVTAIQFVSPLVTVLLAALMLGEKVGIYRSAAVVVGFCGVLIILSPYLAEGFQLSDTKALGTVLAVVGAMLMALAMIQVRQLTGSETTVAIVFYFSVFCSVFALFSAPFGWVMPDLETLALLIVIGLIGGVAQILLTQGYRYAPASLLAPFDYTAMLWSLAIGYVIFAEVPTATILLGAGIVISAGLFVIWRERQLGLRREREKQIGG